MDGKHSEDSLNTNYPISAVVGAELAVEAICCGICSPDIHTILLIGPAGTAKSVLARGASAIALGRKAVELPSNATCEQIFGSVDLENALTNGRKAVSDSIMKRADGNILIADNINLLPTGTLQSVLNYVQEGEYLTEMDGISLKETCDTLLIGTMDPSDNELDEHLLDRFDICIMFEGLEDESDRMEVLRRRIAYDRDPSAFISAYESQQNRLRGRIQSAKPRKVHIAKDYPKFVSDICASMNVTGHRGDIAVINTACALAALDGRDIAGMQDLKKAVELCLQHRRHDDPSPPPTEEEEPQENENPPEDSEQKPPEQNEPENSSSEPENSPEDSESSPNDEEGKSEESDGDAAEKVFSVGEEFRVSDYIPPENKRNRNNRSGRQDVSISKDGTGRTIGYMIPVGKPHDISLTASMLVAAPKQKYRGRRGMAIAIHMEDLREKVRVRNKGTEVLFVVDGSGSMGAHSRMVAVKGAILSMLNDAYKKRDEVGLVVFRGNTAEEILPLTRSVLVAYRMLKEIPTGGRTPLNAGIRKGYEILSRSAKSNREPVMVILTDGRGNIASSGSDPTAELKNISKVVSESKIRTIIVDTETGLLSFGRSRVLAEMLGASYIKLEDLNAEHLSSSIKTALDILTGE